MKILGYDMTTIAIIVLAFACIAGIASRFLIKKTDNVIEETAERIIKNKTGVDIDLSPDTPDGDDTMLTNKVAEFVESVEKKIEDVIKKE